MGKRNVKWVIIFAVVIIICIIYIHIFTGYSSKIVADVYVSDKLMLHIDDISNDDLQKYTVKTDDGYNEICWQNNEIWIESADCDNQNCVKFGKLRTQGISIICAPHKLIITVSSAD